MGTPGRESPQGSAAEVTPESSFSHQTQVIGVDHAVVAVPARMRSSLLFPCCFIFFLLSLKTEEVRCEPGHMVHDYYKCQAEFFKDSIQCREEAVRAKELEREGRRRRLSGGAGRKSNEGTFCLSLVVILLAAAVMNI